jgi:hypothetical protein
VELIKTLARKRMLILVSLPPNGRPKDILKILRQLNNVTSAKEVTDKQVISAGMHRPVCPECECEMRPETNGVGVLDTTDNGPYALWDADLWKCPKCNKKVVGGFSYLPMSEHFRADFLALVKRYKQAGKLINNND